MFRVDPKTVTRWAKAGKLTSIRTLGGHRRYRESEVRALLAGIPQQRSGLDAYTRLPPQRRSITQRNEARSSHRSLLTLIRGRDGSPVTPR